MDGLFRRIEVILHFLVVFVLGNRFTIGSLELEGSQTSFLKYPAWNPCQNGSLSFEFQTTQLDGLLLYSDSRQNDFLEVKLINGVVRLRINLGDGTILINSGQKLDDGSWHKVEIIRNNQETSLVLNNFAQTKLSPGSNYKYAFANSSQNNYVFMGGLPIVYSAHLSSLALPSVIFEPHFRGSFRNVIYSSCGLTQQRQEMLDGRGVRTKEGDSCRHRDPCLNGGFCISTDTESLCDCTRTDYEGKYCDVEKIPSEATFYGAEFLSYDLSDRGDPIVSSNDQITLYFKTRQANGLIFYTGDHEDYMACVLQEGRVSVAVKLGFGSFRPKVEETRFDDNLWHKLVVIREAREVTVRVDDAYERTGTVTGGFTMLASKQLFIAGSPKNGQLAGGLVKENFRGCLRKVIYRADSISLDVTDLARNGHSLIQVHGDILFNKCENLIQSQPITFTIEESYVVIDKWDAKMSGTLEFQFRTNEPHGLLMYNNGIHGSSDFFALEIFDRHLYLLLDLGSGLAKVNVSHSKVNDGMPHKVVLVHNNGAGTISLDGFAKNYTSQGHSSQLDLQGPMFVGGVDGDWNSTHRFPPQLWSAMLHYGYVGCMQDLVINGRKVDLAYKARTQGVDGVQEYCHQTEPACVSSPCLNHGHCHEGWNRFKCDCSSTEYIGTTCNKEATTLSFDGTQFMRIRLEKESKTQVEEISIRFKTQRSNGLLLGTTSLTSSDRIELMLEGGHIKLDINIGDGAKSLYAGRNLDNDKWHTVHVKRRAKHLQLQVDRQSLSSEKITGNSRNLEYDRIEIAKRPQGDDPSASKMKARENFVGHMQQLDFNGDQYFEMARTGELQNMETSANFEKKDKLVTFPITFKSAQAYASTRLRIYTVFSIYFQFRTNQPNGLIMYCGSGKGKDFLAIELYQGLVHFIYNTGSGPRIVRSSHLVPMNDNKWHDIGIIRHTLTKTFLKVDGNTTVDNLPDTRSVHFDTNDKLYIGGTEPHLYSQLPPQVKSTEGFQGCLASIDLDGDNKNLLEQRAKIPSQFQGQIVEGCHGSTSIYQGPQEECHPTACHHGGVCIQEWNTFRCKCDMTSFTGKHCDQDSIGYYFGNGDKAGLISFTHFESDRVDRKQDVLALGFITTQKDAILLRINSGLSSDYIEMEMVDGQIYVVYNMGTMDHPIGALFNSVNDGQYHIVRFTRTGPNSTIQVDDLQVQSKFPSGQQLNVFNSQTYVHIGGGRDSTTGRILRPFQGAISGLSLNGLRVLDLAASGDSRISIEGEVVLARESLYTNAGVTALPNQPVINTPFTGDSVTGAMQSTMGVKPMGEGVTDDLIFSGGSGCTYDDEDDCHHHGNVDDLIKPGMKIHTTPQPPTTTPSTTPMSWGSGSLPCGDDEDCEDDTSGYGDEEEGRDQGNRNPGGSLDGDLFRTTTRFPWEYDNNGPYEDIDDGKPKVPPKTNTVEFISVSMTETPRRQPTRRPRPTEPPSHNYNEGASKGVGHSKPGGMDNLGINIGLIVGIAGGVVILLLILAYALYKYKSRDEGSYKVDESKNYPYEAPGAKAAINGSMSKSGMMAAPPSCASAPSSKPKKNVKEWYV